MNKNPLIQVVLSMISLIIMLLFVLFFSGNNILLTILILIIYGLSYLIYHVKNELRYFLIFALMGAFAEIIGATSKVWVYSNSTVGNIPLWLPFAWGSVGAFTHRMILNLKK